VGALDVHIVPAQLQARYAGRVEAEHVLVAAYVVEGDGGGRLPAGRGEEAVEPGDRAGRPGQRVDVDDTEVAELAAQRPHARLRAGGHQRRALLQQLGDRGVLPGVIETRLVAQVVRAGVGLLRRATGPVGGLARRRHRDGQGHRETEGEGLAPARSQMGRA